MAASRARRFDRGQWKHVRGSDGNPAGVVYQGSKPYTYKTVKGESRTVKPGARVSRRQYENLRYQGSGWQSKAEYERVARGGKQKMHDRGRHVHEADAYRVWGKIYAEEHGLSRIPAGPDNPYAQAYADALRDKFRDTGPDSPFAKLLVLVGLRDESWQWDVGDTPSSK